MAKKKMKKQTKKQTKEQVRQRDFKKRADSTPCSENIFEISGDEDRNQLEIKFNEALFAKEINEAYCIYGAMRYSYSDNEKQRAELDYYNGLLLSFGNPSDKDCDRAIGLFNKALAGGVKSKLQIRILKEECKIYAKRGDVDHFFKTAEDLLDINKKSSNKVEIIFLILCFQYICLSDENINYKTLEERKNKLLSDNNNSIDWTIFPGEEHVEVLTNYFNCVKYIMDKVKIILDTNERLRNEIINIKKEITENKEPEKIKCIIEEIYNEGAKDIYYKKYGKAAELTDKIMEGLGIAENLLYIQLLRYIDAESLIDDTKDLLFENLISILPKPEEETLQKRINLELYDVPYIILLIQIRFFDVLSDKEYIEISDTGIKKFQDWLKEYDGKDIGYILSMRLLPQYYNCCSLVYQAAVRCSNKQMEEKYRKILTKHIDDAELKNEKDYQTVVNCLSGESKLLYQNAYKCYCEVIEDTNHAGDVGIFSLGFFRIIEVEYKKLICSAFTENGKSVQEITDVINALRDCDKNVINVKVKRNKNDKVPIQGTLNRVSSTTNLSLEGIRDILYVLTLSEGDENSLTIPDNAEVNKTNIIKKITVLRNMLFKFLTPSGQEAFLNGELASAISKEMTSDFRNLPAHGRYMPFYKLEEAKCDVSDILLKLYNKDDGWIKSTE